MTKRHIAVFGYGPGISHAIASRFGREGFEASLVSRTQKRLDEGVEALAKQDVVARAFPCDLADPARTRQLVERLGSEVGPVTVYQWNAMSLASGDIVEAEVEALQRDINVGITSLMAGLKPAVSQMKNREGAAVLITGGGFAAYDDAVDNMIAKFDLLGLAAIKAAQRKLVATLSAKLKSEGIFVGEVVVTQMVKGTAFDRGEADLDPAAVGDAFWKLYSQRSERSLTCP